MLNAPQTYRDELQRALIAGPELSDLASSWPMADTANVVRIRLLRAIRDIESAQHSGLT